ncbi:MAG: hypothetical protein P9L99_10370 [Candidatus Lernaella stagnicola]|nr:hypothetical protein [Candidatus Lernaella stagnicola]
MSEARPTWWMRSLLGLPVAGGVVLGAWYGLVLDVALFSLLWLLAALTLLALRFALRHWPKTKPVSRFLSVLLWLMAVAAWLTMFYPALLVSLPLTIVLLALATAAYVIEQRKTLRDWPVAVLPLFAAFAAGLPRFHWLLLGLPLVMLGLAAATRTNATYYPRGLRWLLALWVAMLGSVLVPFYQGRPSGSTEKILAQPGVTAIFDYRQKASPLRPLLGDKTRFGVPDCHGDLLLGTRHGDAGLVRVEGENAAIAHCGPVSDFIAVDCPRNRINVGLWNSGSILRLRHDDLTSEGVVVTHDIDRISKLWTAPDGTVYASADNAKRLLVVYPDQDQPESWEFPHFVTDWIIDPDRDRLVIASWGGSLYTYRLSDRRLLGQDRVRDFLIQLTYDPAHEILWVHGFYTGRLVRFDLRTSRRTAERRLEPGIRFSALTKDGRLVVGNFFTGDLREVDAVTLAGESRRHVGRRLRNVTYDARRHRIIAASALGVFALTPMP